MMSVTDWSDRCQFIRSYFLGPQRQIAHELAVHLAEKFGGDRIYDLRPETSLVEFLGLSDMGIGIIDEPLLMITSAPFAGRPTGRSLMPG